MDGLIRPRATPRVGEPEEVGFTVAYPCSDRAAFVTGVALPVMAAPRPDRDRAP
jgi:NAD(P)-dependent dehydrogenase (short-subunit alcohol dehydrogenase family)